MANLMNLDFSHIEDEECRKACEDARDELLAAVPMTLADGDTDESFEYTGKQAVLARALMAIGKYSSGSSQYGEHNTFDTGPIYYGTMGLVNYSLHGSHVSLTKTVAQNEFNYIKSLASYDSFDDIEPGDIFIQGTFSSSAYEPIPNNQYGVILGKTDQVGSTTSKLYIATCDIYKSSASSNIADGALVYIRTTTITKASFNESYYKNSLLLSPAPYPLLPQSLTNKVNYQNIANAIRERGGFTDTYYPFEMSQAILDIPHDDTSGQYQYEQTIYALNKRQNFTTIDEDSFPNLNISGSSYGINDYLFAGCRNITSINVTSDMIGGSDTFKIGNHSFIGGIPTTLEDFVITCDEGIKCTADAGAFSYCNMKTITGPFSYITGYPPSNTIDVNNRCFSGCNRLHSLVITYTGGVCSTVSTAKGTNFLGGRSESSGGLSIYVPDDLVDDYKASDTWAYFVDKIYPLSDFPA